MGNAYPFLGTENSQKRAQNHSALLIITSHQPVNASRKDHTCREAGGAAQEGWRSGYRGHGRHDPTKKRRLRRSTATRSGICRPRQTWHSPPTHPRHSIGAAIGGFQKKGYNKLPADKVCLPPYDEIVAFHIHASKTKQDSLAERPTLEMNRKVKRDRWQ